MFLNTQNFNQDISGWDVSNVISFRAIFNRSKKFNNSNKSLNSNFKIKNVTDMAQILMLRHFHNVEFFFSF